MSETDTIDNLTFSLQCPIDMAIYLMTKHNFTVNYIP